jgi:hypothetical protein
MYKKSAHYTARMLIIIAAVIVAIVTHELHYGFVKEWFAAPEGKVWMSSGGKYSKHDSIFF